MSADLSASDEVADLGAFEARLRGMAQGTPRAAPDSMPPSLLAWLALAPVWPEAVATRGFPLDTGSMGSGEAVTRTLVQAERQGLVKSANGEPPWRGRWYSMDRGRRVLAIEQLLADGSRGGIDFLRREVARMGKALIEAPLRGYPPPLARFAALAAAVDTTSSIGRALDKEVEAVLAVSRERKDTACPEAKRWIETAEPLVPIFGDDLKLALERSRRRLELFERRSRDERFLRDYTERPALERAFLDLLEPSAQDSWALHYVGDGGMGKTMLIRRIATHFAEQYGLVTSRIDFDHINPDYPSNAPGLLLMAFAEDLKLDEDNVVADQLRRFDEAINAVHRSYEGSQRSGTMIAQDVLLSLDQAERLFIQVLRTIDRPVSRRSTVVLILDTCEELARMRPDGVRPEAVEKTFALLERLHDAVPELRVVFSGRRRLAESGDGWTTGVTGTHRKFLRRAVVGGFDREEADRFLAGYGRGQRQVGSEQRQVGSEYWDAIRKLSVITPAQDTPSETADGAAPIEDVRFNPYDLNLYASWATSGSIDPAKLLSAGANFYALERVVARLAPPIRHWLPLLTRLGVFDRKLLVELDATSTAGFDTVLEEITAQEWIDVARGAQWTDAPGEPQATTTWRADPNIARRVTKYYVEDESTAWADAERRLLEVLPALVIARPWREITLEYIVVALELLAPQPDQALRWWGDLESKLVRDRRWKWGVDIVERLREQEQLREQEWPDAVSAALYITEAAMHTKLGVKADRLPGLWREARRLLDEVADSPPIIRLRYRAHVGCVSALRWSTEPQDEKDVPVIEGMLDAIPEPPDLVQPDGTVDAELATTKLSLIDNTIEILERIEWNELAPPSVISRLESRIAELDPQLPESGQRFLEVRAARLRRLGGQGDVPLTYEAFPQDDEWMRREYQDWSPPQDWVRRVLLERSRLLRFVAPAHSHIGEIRVDTTDTPQVVPQPIELFWHTSQAAFASSDGGAGRPETLDADRAAAAALLWASDYRLPADATDGAVEASLALNAKLSPQCYAHRGVPPFFQVALEVRADRGRGDEVLAFCSRIAEDSSRPLDVRLAAERVKAYIATAWRLRERGVALQSSLETSTLVDDYVRVAGVAAYDPKSSDYKGRWNPDSLATARSRLVPKAVQGWHEWLDDLEGGNFTLQQPQSQQPQSQSSLDPSPSSPRLSPSTEPRAPAALIATPFGVAAEERSWALGARSTPQLQCGARFAAKVALDEAGLLAMRKPVEALQLLAFAAARFKDCNDLIGSLLCAAATVVCRARTASSTPDGAIRLEEALQTFDTLRVGQPSSDDIWIPWATRIAAVRQLQQEKSQEKSPAGSPAQLWPSGIPPDMRWITPAPTPEEPKTSQTTVSPLRWAALSAGLAVMLVSVSWLTFDRVREGIVDLLGRLSFQGTGLGNYVSGDMLGATGVVGMIIAAFVVYGALILGNQGGTRVADIFKVIGGVLTSLFGAVVGLALIGGGLRLMYDGFEWALAFVGLHPGTWVKVVAFTLLLFLMGSIGVTFRLLIAAVEKVGRVTCTLTLVGADAASGTTSDAFTRYKYTITARTRLSNRTWLLFEVEEFVLPFFDETVRYAERAEKLPLAVNHRAFRTTYLLGLFGIATDVEVVVPASSATVPWEALVAARWVPSKTSAELRLRFRRTAPADTRALIDEGTSQPQPVFAKSPLIVSLITRTTDAVQLRDQWQKVSLDANYFALRTDGSTADSAGDGAGAVGILHVLDEILLTERGLALRVGETTQLFATEVVRRWPDLRLVILQLPWRPDARRFDYDRVEAERARLFAAHLYEAGVPAVLVLPSMPQALGLSVLKPLIEVIAKRPKRAMPKLNRVVQEARETIAETIGKEAQPAPPSSDATKKTTASTASDQTNSATSGPPAPHVEQIALAAAETPFDVCFYCNSMLSFAIRPTKVEAGATAPNKP